MEKVTVVDAVMGSGKTSWAFDYIDGSPTDRKFIYITPFLDEVERVKKSVKNRSFIEPNNANSEGRKLRSLKELIAAGHDICATHSLFQAADDELIDLLEGAEYTLILDEVMNVIEAANIKDSDIKTLFKAGHIGVVGNQVRWIGDDYLDGRFNDIKLIAKAGNLFQHRGKYLIRSFPSRVFKAFRGVIVMTYLFDAQIQRYYYDFHNIQYVYKSVKRKGERYVLTDYDRQLEHRE
ncbi:hypothetical protein P4642_16635, partial [Halalkalibacterium halodurans]|nr:hypothetical protein [Halalkalibacterium halodurans]